MPTETVEMTRRELEVQLALAQGWKWYEWRPGGGSVRLIQPNMLKRVAHFYVEIPYYDRNSVELLDVVPKYTSSISAAHPLIQLVRRIEGVDNDTIADRRYRWRSYWDEAPRLENIEDESEAARHISIAAYYALTGVRVTLKEGESDE